MIIKKQKKKKKKRKRRKNTQKNKPKTIMKTANRYIITLNINRLNALTKIHRLPEWLQK